jgi:hypothetical protein
VTKKSKGHPSLGIDCCSQGWLVLVGSGLVEWVTSVELDSPEVDRKIKGHWVLTAVL